MIIKYYNIREVNCINNTLTNILAKSDEYYITRYNCIIVSRYLLLQIIMHNINRVFILSKFRIHQKKKTDADVGISNT